MVHVALTKYFQLLYQKSLRYTIYLIIAAKPLFLQKEVDAYFTILLPSKVHDI